MRKGIFKKLTSAFLALCLVLGIMPAMASAAEAGNNISDEVIEDESMLIIPITSEAPVEETSTTEGASNEEVQPVADYEPSTDPDIVTGKTRRSFYRDDKVDALRSNIEKYTWAQGSRDYYTRNAEKFLGNEEKLWNSVTTQELPRSYYTGFRADPKAAHCRYCGVDMNAEYGTPYYAWIIDAWNTPWKIQCPSCRKTFPTNDFGSFYQLGIDEYGNWSYELAKSENQKLVKKGEKGYLVNETLPEKGSTWGVDDGWGYVDPNSTFTDSRGNVLNSTHTYISFYNHWGIWHTSLLYDAADWLGNAYLYTGDERYGNAGAILMDRIADVYPDLTTEPFRHQMTDGGHYAPKGKASDYIWENQLAKRWCETYDAVWPAYENEAVISFLSDKASQYKMENDKTTPAKIRQNVEDGLLREIYRSYKIHLINGNFGMPQSTLAIAAVVLDTMPETKEMIDFIFQDGEAIDLDGGQPDVVTGGNVNRQIFDAVDANGVTDEVAPNYSDLWVGGLSGLINYLEGYDKYEAADLYKNPRYVKMFTHQLPTLLRRKATVQIGDSGATAKDSFIGLGRFAKLYENTKNPVFAQALFHNNGRSTKGLTYGVYHSDPESLARDVQAVIDTYGEYDFDKSVNLTDYGFAHIKSVSHENIYNRNEDSERSFWMYYGRYAGHGHRDALNLGIEAKGLSVAPELGYPDGTTGDRYDGWGKTTVTHNTVIVNDGRQQGNRTTGTPYHFDGTEKVKVMDASAEKQYGIETYRRTVISVDIDDENSYAVDLFHIKGGISHLYSFHALSDTIAETENLNLVPQTDSKGNYVGTYRGASYTYGQYDSKKMGYNYLYNVDRAKNVSGGNFMVDFKITDFRNVRNNPNQDTHLRMTMINGFDLAEVAIADGNPPNKDFNPETLKWVLVRRSGTSVLNTLFTTVFEPYDNESNIESIENAEICRADGKTIGTSEVRALKITLKNGRVDYVTVAKDSSVEYIVDNFLTVKGFVTVYSVKDGKNVYSYVNDGTKVGDLTAQDAYNGSIVDFTKENAFKNTITVNFAESEVDTDDLIGRFMYVNHGGEGNATYEILDVTKSGDNYILDIGDITLIDKLDDDGNYVYKIAAGNTFRIPLSKVKESDEDIYYNFLKAYNYGATDYIGNSYVQKITYDKTTAGSEYELNKRLPSAPWAFHSYVQGGSSGNDYYKYNEPTYGIALAHMTREKCATASLKLKVENTGSYIPMVNISGSKNYNRAAFAKMSLCKLNADGTIGDAIASRHINTANYTAKDHYVALCDTPVNIPAGEYVFVINQDHVSGVTVVDGLSLVKAEKAVATGIKLGYEEGLVEVNVGETASTPISITMSDGSKAKLSDLEVEFLDDSIVDYSISDNKVNFTGLKVGTTQMTIRHGKAMVRTNVKVNAKDTTVAPADLHYNFYKSMPENVQSVVNHYYSNTFNYATSTNGAYGEVREDLTSTPWAVVSKKDVNGNDDPDLYFSRLYTSYAFLYYGAGTVTLRLKVPVDGMYSPAMIIGVNNHKVAATYSITSLDGTTTYSSKTIPAGTTAGEVAISDAPIALKAGDYLLTMSKQSGNNFLDGVSLDYEGEYTGPETSTVTLDYGTGTSTVTATYGEAMPSITVPIKEGFIFEGYFDGKNGTGTQYYKADGSGATTWDKTENVTLYAKWVEGSDVFGTKGAFIRNLKETSGTTTKYKLYLFSGIDHLDYADVGFEVTINGYTAKLSTKEVYDEVKASNTTIVPTTIGAKCQKIFAYNINVGESYKTSTVKYRPYAIDKDGNTIYGKEITIDGIYTKSDMRMLSEDTEYQLELE